MAFHREGLPSQMTTIGSVTRGGLGWRAAAAPGARGTSENGRKSGSDGQFVNEISIASEKFAPVMPAAGSVKKYWKYRVCPGAIAQGKLAKSTA